MRILLDLDGPVINLHPFWLDIYNKTTGDNLEPHQVTDWAIHKFAGEGKRIYEFLQHPDLYKRATAIPGAIDGVSKLREQGHEIVYVTTNTVKMTDEKAKWLAMNGLLLAPPIIEGMLPKDMVVTACKEMIEGDVLVDDNPYNVLSWLKTKGGPRKGSFAVLYAKPWNKKFEAEVVKLGGMIADDWRDLLVKIQAISAIKAKADMAYKSLNTYARLASGLGWGDRTMFFTKDSMYVGAAPVMLTEEEVKARNEKAWADYQRQVEWLRNYIYASGAYPVSLAAPPKPRTKSFEVATTEQKAVIDSFVELLIAVTADGGKKRAAGTKPPWFRDPSHRAAILSHLSKDAHGEKQDKDSGAHPFVHLAWRALAVAYQETKGQVDPEQPPVGRVIVSTANDLRYDTARRK